MKISLKEPVGKNLHLDKLDTLLFSTLMIIVASCTFYLFYNQIFNRTVYYSDAFSHVSSVMLIFDTKTKVLPHIGLQSTIFHLSKLFSIGYFQLAPYLFTAAYLLNFMLLFYVITTSFKDNYFLSGLIALALLLVSAIYLPIKGEYLSLGPLTPNPWHNPTYTMMRPFAFIAFCAVATYLKKENFYYLLLAGIALLIATFYKPSFTITFLPALLIFIIVASQKRINMMIMLFIFILPTIILLLFQYHAMGNARGFGGIILSPLRVLNFYTHHIIISLLRAIAFPLSLLLLNFRSVSKDKVLWLAWINSGVAYSYFLLFAIEDGILAGDFGWGYEMGLYILFVFSMINLINSYSALITERFGKSRLAMITVIFLAHLATGIYLFYIILIGKAGWVN